MTVKIWKDIIQIAKEITCKNGAMKIGIITTNPISFTGINELIIRSYDEAQCVFFNGIDFFVEQSTDILLDYVILDIGMMSDGLAEAILAVRQTIGLENCIVMTFKKEFNILRNLTKDQPHAIIYKESCINQITYGLKSALLGYRYVDPNLFVLHLEPCDMKIQQLTEREKDVFELIGKGYSNIEIGRRLFISVNTVKKHVSRILSKLDVSDRTQAAIKSINYLNKANRSDYDRATI